MSQSMSAPVWGLVLEGEGRGKKAGTACVFLYLMSLLRNHFSYGVIQQHEDSHEGLVLLRIISVI